jgi:glycosyltransferase involved in cell wall biosynthesis
MSHASRLGAHQVTDDTMLMTPSDPRPRRVLFVVEAFGGGLFEITRMQAEGLAGQGYSVAIAFGRRPETPAQVEDLIDKSVELIPLPWGTRSAITQVRAHLALRRVIRSWQPDVIHLMSSFAGLHGALAARGVPTVYTPQAYSFTISSAGPWKRWAYFLLESLVAARVTVVGACSLSEGEQARSLPGARSVAVVPNGIQELEGPPQPEVPQDHGHRHRVVALGRALPQRRPEACARIFGIAGLAGEALWLGGAEYGNSGTAALAAAGIEVTGWLPRAETLTRLQQSTVYLHWTAWDGLPLSILEAMALDVVVVASDIGPNREVLGPDQVCRTERAAADLISRLLVDEELRGQFLASQRTRRLEYRANRMVTDWMRVYDEVLSDTREGQ